MTPIPERFIFLRHPASTPSPPATPSAAVNCCRQWDVGLLPSEYDSGRYQSATICSYDRKTCTGKQATCIQRRYQLQKKADTSCVYLGGDSTCTMYAERPKVCRDFSCAGGWQLSSVAAAPGAATIPAEASQNPYVGELHGAVVLMPNPLLILKTVFYSHEARELAMVTRPVSKCMVTSHKIPLDVGPLTDDQIIAVFTFFDGRSATEAITAKAVDLGVSKDVVYELVMKFMHANLLVPVVGER